MDDKTLTVIITLVLMLVFIIVPLFTAIRVVPEYQRLVILMLGRYRGTRGPGLVFVIPFLEQTLKVDLRQITLDIPARTFMTEDEAAVSPGIQVGYRIVDPMLAKLHVENLEKALTMLTTTTFRTLVSDATLDELSHDEKIHRQLQTKLNDAAERLGVRIVSVEIREEENSETSRKKSHSI